MSPSNPAKFGIAFALGLVVALAGVTVYVKSSGLRVEQAPAPTAVVHQINTPETLNAPKPDEPPVVQPPPEAKVVTPPLPAVATVAPAPVPMPATPPKPVVHQKAAPRPATHLVRTQYPVHHYPESSSTIRVEVSQIRKSTDPVTSEQPVPVAANQPIRTVDEEQAQPIAVAPPPPPAVPVPIAAPRPQPHTVTLARGTNVSIRIGETLSSEKNTSGDTFRATLDRPIILDGFIIAEKGSRVVGKISALDKGSKFDGGANLQLALVEINTTDGQRVRIQTGFVNRKGPASNGSEFAKVGGGAVLGALIGGLAGGGKGAAIGAGAGGAVGAGAVAAGKGRPAVITAETQLTFQLSAPTTITEHLN